MNASLDDVGPIDIAEDVLAIIKPDLNPGERLIWASRQGPRARGDDWGSRFSRLIWSIAFGTLTITCVLIFHRTTHARFESFNNVVAFTGFISGITSFFLGVNFIVGLVTIGLGQPDLKSPAYALTDRRAMIWVPIGRSVAVDVHTFPRGSIKGQDLHRVQYPDGTGDLFFRNEVLQPAGFLDISDVRRVEDLVRRFLIDDVS